MAPTLNRVLFHPTHHFVSVWERWHGTQPIAVEYHTPWLALAPGRSGGSMSGSTRLVKQLRTLNRLRPGAVNGSRPSLQYSILRHCLRNAACIKPVGLVSRPDSKLPRQQHAEPGRVLASITHP